MGMYEKFKTYLKKKLKKEPEVPLIDQLENLIDSSPDSIEETADDRNEIALVSNVERADCRGYYGSSSGYCRNKNGYLA